MSFAFGFTGDDISEEDDDIPDEPGRDAHQSARPDKPSVTLKRFDLKTLLASLPSQISYNVLLIPSPPDSNGDATSANAVVQVPRRSIFDIRTQLMAEADDDENENDTLLKDLDLGDLSSGVYEGGFKTWECSVDLAQMLMKYDLNPHTQGLEPESNIDWDIIELGAGSAIPSMMLFQRAMSSLGSGQVRSFHFTICDYNEDVLKLCTVPNILLNYLQASDHMPRGEQDLANEQLDHDIDLEELRPQTHGMIDELASANISFNLVSGPWGRNFVDRVTAARKDSSSPNSNLLILASETIYSPETLLTFCDTLLSLLNQHSGPAKALVAAKRIYFGVGGGVDEFVREITSKGGQVNTVFETASGGVSRVVLEVTVPR